MAEELLLNTRLTEESKSRARNLLKELGLYEYRDAHPSTLSGGQNMRLIAERLKSEAQHGRTILVITHDRELIESCCDNVVEVEKRSL